MRNSLLLSVLKKIPSNFLIPTLIMVNLIFKVFVFSALVSFAIKYGAPYLPVSGTPTTALIMVLSPTILLAIALGWRSQQH
jgi:hypothetical protein